VGRGKDRMRLDIVLGIELSGPALNRELSVSPERKNIYYTYNIKKLDVERSVLFI
jgi:hypothetical protein